MEIKHKDITNLSQKKDFRLTKQRLAILEFLRNDKSHPSAETIYGSIKRQYPAISFGTVYRNLNFLKEHGFIKEFIIDKVTHFEGRVDSHVHLICEGCGKISDLDDNKLVNQLKRLSEHKNFYTRYESFSIYGYCPECQKKLTPKQQTPELFCIACGNLLEDLNKEAPVCRACCFSTNCNYYGRREPNKSLAK